jgi:hypothetical protein
MSRTVIVTGADAAYFELLSECIRSIRACEAGREVALRVLDCGLDASHRAWLEEQGAGLVLPSWDFDSALVRGLPPYMKAMTARPFLPRYFPGFDTIVWIDADAWVQDWSAVDLLVQASADGALAAVPEIDRAFRHYRHAWSEFSAVIGGAYRKAYGDAVADELTRWPMINAGVFALGRQSSAWSLWARALEDGLRRSSALIDQLALNVAVYQRGLRHHPLPAWCNWPAHHATPAWDPGRKLFVEPYLPHAPIGILHLTVWTKQEPLADVREVGVAGRGALRPMSLRYAGRPGSSLPT